ncbi:MAG TPA: cyclase family protein [Candidatus Saccharimonadales bacterium]|nr:cyclase family protein [Candidatus Saccharimonadales bacterium]
MLIDLSIKLNQDTPAYPGDPTIDLQHTEQFEKDGYSGHQVTMGTHTGTHIDAPAHMLAGGQTLGQFPLETFVGIGKCIDARTEFSVAACEAVGIEEGDIVLFNTGMAHQLHDATYFTDYPVMDDALTAYLVGKRVKMVGLDTCSADNTDDFRNHKMLLGNNIPILENLTNLDSLPERNFMVNAFPLSLDVDGAPTRAVAEVPES